jgi:penicillin-binding protein 1A
MFRQRVAAALVCTAVLAGLLTGLLIGSLFQGLPDETAILRMGEMAQVTSVFDRNDRLAFTLFREQRIDVRLEDVSPHLQAAIIAIEDRRFYEHGGIDAVRIASSVLANVRHFGLVQGGSTITQQLARQSFLTSQKTLRRKLQEALLARRIEREYDKRRILELYLNKIYFGDGLHGVEAASRGYFGKHASALTIDEAALLAGLVKSPSAYAPTVNLERARNRRNIVLDAMLETGAVTRSEWEAARSASITLKDDLRDIGPYGQYFKEQVRRALVERFGNEAVYAGGLRVFSTLDVAMQQAAETAMTAGLASLERQRAAAAARASRSSRARAASNQTKDADQAPLQAAVFAMDPTNGHVRAVVGGRDFSESRFNRASQAMRQPGSAFKPFVFAAALESGYSPASIIRHLDEPVATSRGFWSPEDDHSDVDSLSLREALRISSNRAAARLLEDVGIGPTLRYAANLGVGEMPEVPSLALGSGEVTLQTLTAAYGAFANRGRVASPMLIRRVEDRDGRVLFNSAPVMSRALSETTAFLMASMMADVVNSGTGARARQLGFTLPAGGKTGTTNEYRDAWFVGFTPSLVAGVWVGFDDPKPILPNGYASDVAVPIWAGFMKSATRGDAPRWLTPPAKVTRLAVCRVSGKLATSACDHVATTGDDGTVSQRSTVYLEYFAAGTEPVESCDVHATRGFFSRIASAVGVTRKPAPQPAPPVLASTSTNQAVQPSQAESEQPPKKRGFWSRLFGIGRDKADRTEQPVKQK